MFGNLTTDGVTREVKLELILQGADTDPWGNDRAGAEVQGTLNRKDFDMQFNQALGSGNALVGDKVRFSLDLSAILQKQRARARCGSRVLALTTSVALTE